MPVSCAASGCKSRYTLQAREKGITFHRFPRSNPVLLEKWRLALRRGELWMPSRYQRLCSLHFKESCFDTTGQTKRLRGDVIPSIFNFPFDIQSKVSEDKPYVTPAMSRASVPEAPKEKQIPNPSVLPETVQQEQDSEAGSSTSLPLQDHLYFIPDVETLKRKLLASEESRAQKEKELRNAKDREKRLRKICPSIYQELRKANLLSPELRRRLQPYKDMTLEVFRKLEPDYSPQQRMFALTLQLYDAKVYPSLRNDFKLPLPGLKRLRQWLKTDCCSSGISSLVLSALLSKRQERPDLYTQACLIFDTLPIRKHISFDSEENKLVGFVSFGKDSGGSQELASSVLVMMLVGTAGHWKAPIAHFLTNEPTVEAQKQLLIHVLYELWDYGFEIVAVTMERHVRNEEMCTLLGCKFDDPWHLQTHFTLPHNNKKYYVYFDVTHEQQIIRDMLVDLGIMHSPDGKIMWQYIEDLMNLPKTAMKQMSENLSSSKELLSALGKAALMVNPLCNTTAKCLTLLQQSNYERFSDASATISLIQILDRLFDIVTSRKPQAKSYKGPVNDANLQQVLCVLQETEEYLLSLTTCDNTPVYRNARCALNGLLVNITSLISLLPNLLVTQDHIMMHKLSTDHLKLFFHGLKKQAGLNKSPTAADVNHALRQIFSQCGLGSTDLSSQPVETKISFLHVTEDDRVPCIFRRQLPPVFQETSISLPDHFYSSHLLDLMLQNSEMYIAGWVVREAFEQVACNKCRWALVMEDPPQDFRNAYHLLQIKNGRAFVPSNGAIKTILTAEKELYHMLNDNTLKHSTFPLLLEHRVLSLLGSQDIFDFKDHITVTVTGIDNHHFQLLRFLTSLYYGIRQAYISRLTKKRKDLAGVKEMLTKAIKSTQ